MTEDRQQLDAKVRVEAGALTAKLLKLDAQKPGLASTLMSMVGVIADEAARTPRFARALADVFPADSGRASETIAPPRSSGSTPRRGKRSPGALDPFAVYREVGESGLRDRLCELDIDQLKDIIAEHGMDYDKLAMRWRTAKKLQDRVVAQVLARECKGDVFR